MKIGTENKNKLILSGVFGFIALLCLIPLYNELFGGPSSPPPNAPPVVRDETPGTRNTQSVITPGKAVTAPPGFIVGGKDAVKVGTAGRQLDPTLHMEAMLVTESLVYSGSGRNIFGAEAPPPLVMAKAETPKGPARPPVQTAPPPIAGPVGPPPLPPIDLKFFGTATAGNGIRRAFLLHGDDVFLASAGDVVQRRYRVVTIAANSIVVEDIPNANKQTLPLAAN